MKYLYRIVFACLALHVMATSVLSQKGVVAYRVASCDFFVVYMEKTDDYVLAEWYGGYDPEKGDVVYGSFGSYGLKEVNYLRSSKGKLYIEEYGLDKGDALEKLYESCE